MHVCMYVCILINQSIHLGCGFSGTDFVFKRRGKSIYCSCVQQGCFRWKIKSTSCHFNRLYHSPIPRSLWEPACVYHTESLGMLSHVPTQLSVSYSSYCKRQKLGRNEANTSPYTELRSLIVMWHHMTVMWPGYKSCDCHTDITQGPVVLSRDHHDVSGTDRYV